jgi:two-component system, NarL family, sensor histidine kinase UhpB
MMFRSTKASASLRTRLVLIPPVFLLFGIIAAIGATLFDAPDRIAAETASGLTIGANLITYALDDIRVSADPDSALDRLKEELSHVRHIRVGFRPSGDAPAIGAITPERAKSAPAWFVNLFAPRRLTETFPVIFEGERRGELVMTAEPGDEAGEVWDELLFLIGLLSAISIGIVLLTWLAVNYTLRPLRALVEGLDQLEHGQFGGIDKIRVAELQRVGDQFNRLAKSLARTEADNRLLIDELMSIQESERRELARELHDEFGASLFGIRASASCVVEVATAGGPIGPRLREIIDRANSISSLADAIQKHNYRILERIQPIVLKELGLLDALRHLAGAWSEAHRGVVCTIKVPEAQVDLDDDANLTIYRIVQECLTNVARHSKANSVQISVQAFGDQRVILRVADNGVGLPEGFRFGFGFLGMSERARKLGGNLRVSNGRRGGTIVEVSMPLHGAEIARAAE